MPGPGHKIWWIKMAVPFGSLESRGRSRYSSTDDRSKYVNTSYGHFSREKYREIWEHQKRELGMVWRAW